MRTFARVCAFSVVLSLVLLLPARLGLAPPTGLLSSAAFAAEEPAEAAPKGYYPITITGAIGRDFTAAQMETHLKEAERLKPAVVLLVIDSGGGRIDHAEEMVDLIIEHEDLTFIAYVQKALSAAATITLACEKVFVTETATIGGAVSYSLDEKGKVEVLPAEVAEKFQSIWRAVCRKAAQHGRHPSLIAEAMVDPGFALTMRGVGEQVELERDGQGKVLKAKGRILTLTAREAVSCGLSAGLVHDVNAIGQELAIAGWKAIGGQERLQAETVEAPAVLGPKAFITPSSLYSTLYRKVASLGLTDEQTEMQRVRALEEWQKWFSAQDFSAHRVDWTVTLLEASEGQVRFLYNDDDGSLKLAGSVQDPPMSLETLHKRTKAAQRRMRNPTADTFFSSPPSPSLVMKIVGRAKAELRKLRQLEQKTKACPVKVIAEYNNEPRLRLVAWVEDAAKADLLEVEPNTEFTLSGEVGKVIPHLFADGLLVVEVILDRCELPTDSNKDGTGSEEQGRKEDVPASSQQEANVCRGWVQMAKNFLSAGRPDMAIMYAEKVLQKSPDSEYADEAQAIRDEARQTLNPASEPGEAKPEM